VPTDLEDFQPPNTAKAIDELPEVEDALVNGVNIKFNEMHLAAHNKYRAMH